MHKHWDMFHGQEDQKGTGGQEDPEEVHAAVNLPQEIQEVECFV